MSQVFRNLKREVVCGLALLFVLPTAASEPLRDSVRQQLRDENYVLVQGPNGARLFVFSTGDVSAVAVPRTEYDSSKALGQALEMTRSEESKTRVRGLTLLSGVDNSAALDAAMVLLFDPIAAVREEAVQLLIEHPDAEVDGIVAIAANDPSERVRQAAAELIEERLDDRGD